MPPWEWSRGAMLTKGGGEVLSSWCSTQSRRQQCLVDLVVVDNLGATGGAMRGGVPQHSRRRATQRRVPL